MDIEDVSLERFFDTLDAHGQNASTLFDEDVPQQERTVIHQILNSLYLDIALGFMISINAVVIIMEANAIAAHNNDLPTWLVVTSRILLAMYLVELLLRIYIFRASFFSKPHHWIDILVTLGSCVAEFLPNDISVFANLSILRLFRFLRIGFTYRLLAIFPELALMLLGLWKTLKTIFWGMLLLSALLLIYSIAAVLVIHPVNERVARTGLYHDMGCERCPRAFSSVQDSLLTFLQQIIAGGSWGQLSVPIVEAQPSTLIFFILVLVSISLTLLNVFLSVVVEKVQETHQETAHDLAFNQEVNKRQAIKKLQKMLRERDADDNGVITLKELKHNVDERQEWKDALRVLDVGKEHLELIFKVMDPESFGYVPHIDFLKQLYFMKHHDLRMLIVHTQSNVEQIKEHLLFQKGACQKDLQVGTDVKFPRLSSMQMNGIDAPQKDLAQRPSGYCTPDTKKNGSTKKMIQEDTQQPLSGESTVATSSSSRPGPFLCSQCQQLIECDKEAYAFSNTDVTWRMVETDSVRSSNISEATHGPEVPTVESFNKWENLVIKHQLRQLSRSHNGTVDSDAGEEALEQLMKTVGVSMEGGEDTVSVVDIHDERQASRPVEEIFSI